jgi:hypothetical protein
MAASSAERSTIASIAANERWSRTNDRVAATANARKAFSDRFENLVDPEGTLSPDERARRAASARSAHMKRLALRSAKSRRAAAGIRQAAEESKKTAQALAHAASEFDRLAEETDTELGSLESPAPPRRAGNAAVA